LLHPCSPSNCSRKGNSYKRDSFSSLSLCLSQNKIIVSWEVKISKYKHYEFLWDYDATYYVMDLRTNDLMAILDENGLRVDEELIEEFKQIIPEDEDIEDFIKKKGK